MDDTIEENFLRHIRELELVKSNLDNGKSVRMPTLSQDDTQKYSIYLAGLIDKLTKQLNDWKRFRDSL